MNKNIVIGVVVAALVVVLLYFAYQSGVTQNATDLTATSTGEVSNPVTSNPSSPSPSAVATAPTVQTGSSVIPSNSTAVLSGKVTPNGLVTTYWYDYGLTANLDSQTTSQDIGSGFNAITAPAYITGLKANTQYYFRLSAQNRLGTVHGAVYSFSTNGTPPAPGKAPVLQTNSVSDIARTGATLNGHVNPEGFATGYWFEFGETRDMGSLTGFTSIGNGQDSLAVVTALTNLKPLTKYYFRLDAQNQFGTVNGSVGSFTTAGPAVPTVGEPKVTTNAATNISTSSATFNARLDPNGTDTTYWFEYSTDSLVGSVIGTATADQTMNGSDAAIGVKADISGLSRNTRYYYRLVARNSQGTVTGSAVSFRTAR